MYIIYIFPHSGPYGSQNWSKCLYFHLSKSYPPTQCTTSAVQLLGAANDCIIMRAKWIVPTDCIHLFPYATYTKRSEVFAVCIVSEYKCAFVVVICDRHWCIVFCSLEISRLLRQVFGARLEIMQTVWRRVVTGIRFSRVIVWVGLRVCGIVTNNLFGERRLAAYRSEWRSTEVYLCCVQYAASQKRNSSRVVSCGAESVVLNPSAEISYIYAVEFALSAHSVRH